MNLRKVDLNLLTIFDAVMTEGNITRAGEKIGMTQSAISNALNRFRHVTNDELFVREGRNIQPTPKAIQLGKEVRKILDMIANAITESTDFDYQFSKREFTIVFSDYGELVLLPRILAWFKDIGADIKLNVLNRSGLDLKRELHYGGVDLYLWAIPIVDDDIHVEKVITETFYSAVRKDHPTVKDSLSLDQYLALPHVITHWPGEQGFTIDQKLREMGLERDNRLKVSSLVYMPLAVTSSDMICTLESNVAKYFAEIYNLKIFPTPVSNIDMPGYLMWSNSMDEDAGHKWLRTFIIDLCSRL